MHSPRVLICNPYPSWGGGGQIQTSLRRVLEICLPEADVQSISLGHSGAGMGRYVYQCVQALRYYRQGLAADLLILQSYLDPRTVALGRYAQRHQIPYVLIPHGDLVPTADLWFVSRHPGTKWLMWLLFGKQLVERAAAVATTTEMEKHRLERVGARTECFHIIPNPLFVSMPGCNEEVGTVDREGDKQRPFALWLGRVAKEKGLELLLQCWPTVLSVCPRAELILAGPVSYPSTSRRLQDLHRKLGLDGAVRFIDWVGGAEKARLLAEARCLVLPSHFESFGIVILEALSVQTPVIASTGTPWPQIEGTAGRWLPRKPQLWAEAISSYLSTPYKQKVAKQQVVSLLAPYSEYAVAEKWSALLSKILIH